MTENWNKMLSGEVYDATDPQLIEKLTHTKELLYEYNLLRPSDNDGREKLLREVLGKCGESPFVVQPFYCDYGMNIHVGDRFFANFSFTVLDEALVTIGNDAFIGPNVSIYTACHPLDPKERNTKVEWAKPVTIGDSVWIGGSVTILPGVTIGNNCVIGAGSVVTHDIPDNSVAVGNPCRVIRTIGQSD